MYRVVIKDVRTGKLLSVRSPVSYNAPGMEPGDELVEAVPLKYIPGGPVAPKASITVSPDGWQLIGEYQLPGWEDARQAKHSLEAAPWALPPPELR